MSSTVIIITSPPDDGDGLVANTSRVKANFEYTPPPFADPATVEKVRKALQKAADKIVAKYG
jgi:hypothetical protein